MRSHEPAAVLIDLDGTLVDTNYLHVQAWQGALRDHGHDVPAARIHALIGMDGDLLLDDLVGPVDHEVLKDGWRTRFRATRDGARPLPGARDLLFALAARGALVVIASSSEQDDVDALVSLLDADAAIAATTSAADVDEAKPSPEVFEAALAAVAGSPSRAVAIGDSIWDIKAAARAGVDCIGFGSGGIALSVLEDAGAIEVHDGADSIVGHLDDGVLGRLLG